MDFLSEVEKKLDLPPGEKAQVIRELRSHYEELKGELVASGMDADLAAQEASRKLGDPADVVSRLQAIHCRATWKTAFLTAFPLAAMLIVSLSKFPLGLIMIGNHAHKSAIYAYHSPLLIVTAVFGAIFLSGSIRELIRNRRPVWLATWLAVGFMELVSVVTMLEFLSGHFTITQPRVISTVFEMILFGTAAVIAFRGSAKWSAILTGWTLLSLVVYTMLFSYNVFVIGLPLATMIMAIALGVFARHPYGNTALASLFLFAFYAAGIDRYPMTSSVTILATLVSIVVVMAYARSAARWGKMVILSVGILINVSLTAVMSYIQFGMHNPMSFAAEVTFGMLGLPIWVILVPMLFERRWSDRRPEFVR